MDNLKKVLAQRWNVPVLCIEEIKQNLWFTPAVKKELRENQHSIPFPEALFSVKLFGKIKLVISAYEDSLNINNVVILRLGWFIFHEYCETNKIEVPFWYATTHGHSGFAYDAQKAFRDAYLKDQIFSGLSLSPNTQTIHQDCLLLLKQTYQDKNTLFKFRKSRKELNEGYWFDGSTAELGTCLISFWEGYDNKKNSPNIYFEIQRSGSVKLVLSAMDNRLMEAFFEGTIVKQISDFQQEELNGKKVAVWAKTYIEKWEKDYIDVLKSFLSTEKPNIDLLLNKAIFTDRKSLGELNFIQPKIFEQEFEYILETQAALETGQILNNNFENLSKYPLHLKTLALENIGHFRNFRIDLSKRIICLVGENGCGKTTILRALLLALTGVNRTIDFNKNHPAIQQLLSIEGSSKGNKLFALKGSISIQYELDKIYENIISFTSSMSSSNVKIQDEQSLEKENFVLTSGNDYLQLILGFPQLQAPSKEKREYKPWQPNTEDTSALLYDESSRNFEDLAEWIIALDGENKPKKKGKVQEEEENHEVEIKIINFIFEIISEITAKKVYFLSVNHLEKTIWVGIESKIKNQDNKEETKKEEIPFSLLSQGFKNVFAWVGHFIKRMVESNDYQKGYKDKNALVLIDEIDTYLHPKWQRYILNALAKNFPNTQFIVTTHSPFVMSYLKDIPAKDRALYILEKGKIEPKLYDHLYGRGIKSIFLDWMGIGEYPDEIINKTEEIFNLIDQGEKETLSKAKTMMEELELEPDDALMVEIKSWLDMKFENVL